MLSQAHSSGHYIFILRDFLIFQAGVFLVDDLSLMVTKFHCFLGFDTHLNSAAAQSWKKQISLEEKYSKKNFSATPCV